MYRGRKSPYVVVLSVEERAELERWIRSTTIRSGLCQRARIILLRADGLALSEISRRVGLGRRIVRKWLRRFQTHRLSGLYDQAGRGRKPVFSPEVAVHLVKLACERPDKFSRSLSQWDCAELALQLKRDGLVDTISAETVRRILAHHKLKPWRCHLWLSSDKPRDEAFYACVREIVDLYTRPLTEDEVVICIDEKTSLQPRPRLAGTRPALPGLPNRLEHEYKRAGALHLFAGFDTRSGKVYGRLYGRKRQIEFMAFLESLEADVPETIKTIHLICDNLRVHYGKQVRLWLKRHSRFVMHFTPVHCSWLNQIEQWFSILQRKRLRIVDFASIADLTDKIEQFIAQWNEVAHPFNWTTKSVAKVMADAPEPAVSAAA